MIEELAIKLQPLSDAYGSGDVNSDLALVLLVAAALFTLLVFAAVFLSGGSRAREVAPPVEDNAASQLRGMRRELQNDIERLKGEARFLKEELRGLRDAMGVLQEQLEIGQEQARIISLAQSATSGSNNGSTRATVSLRGSSYGGRSER